VIDRGSQLVDEFRERQSPLLGVRARLARPDADKRMPADLPSARAVATASALAFGGIFVLFIFAERPALGIGHLYYIAIALAALAGGVGVGSAAGLLAALLYALGVLINPFIPNDSVFKEGTLLRAATYVVMGAIVGWFASRHRRLVEELQVLANRDALTGLPNTRAFELAISRRLEHELPFLLVLAAFDIEAGAGDELREVADRLLVAADPTDEVSRVAANEFALLTDHPTEAPSELASRLELVLAGTISGASVGWSAYPRDGENALALYRAANERLYARRIFRSYEQLDTETTMHFGGRRTPKQESRSR
jgi:GGDEF domain-containing protein